MKKKLQELIDALKDKKYIFVNGNTGTGKTTLIDMLKKEKEFADYGVKSGFDYSGKTGEKFSIDESNFIEIQMLKDINWVLEKAEDRDEAIKNIKKSGILLDLNPKKQQENNSENFSPLDKQRTILVENCFNNDNNYKTFNIYTLNLEWILDNLDWLRREML